jgi:hypothetical protein
MSEYRYIRDLAWKVIGRDELPCLENRLYMLNQLISLTCSEMSKVGDAKGINVDNHMRKVIGKKYVIKTSKDIFQADDLLYQGFLILDILDELEKLS